MIEIIDTIKSVFKPLERTYDEETSITPEEYIYALECLFWGIVVVLSPFILIGLLGI